MSSETQIAAAAAPPLPERPRRRPAAQRKPSNAGNLKLCLRTEGSEHEKPLTIWADKRHKGEFDLELKQLKAAKERIERNPKYGKVEWAAIYDCTHSEHGPEIFQYTLTRGGWHYHEGE